MDEIQQSRIENQRRMDEVGIKVGDFVGIDLTTPFGNLFHGRSIEKGTVLWVKIYDSEPGSRRWQLIKLEVVSEME